MKKKKAAKGRAPVPLQLPWRRWELWGLRASGATVKLGEMETSPSPDGDELLQIIVREIVK